MNKETLIKLLSQAKYQLVLQVNNNNFILNPKKALVINDLGIIAISEKTWKATIVFLDNINEIIIDSKVFFIKSN